MTVTELDPPRRIAWKAGAASRYAVRAPAVAAAAATLRFTHVFDERYGPAAQHAAGWETYLDRLEALLAGHPIDEVDAHVPIAELHEHYAAHLRAGPHPRPSDDRVRSPSAHLTLEDGPQLRLERRYRHPVERVWRAIDDADERAHWFPDDEPLTVVERRPPHLLIGTWFGDTLRFESHATTARRTRRLPARLHPCVATAPPGRGPHRRGLAPLLRGASTHSWPATRWTATRRSTRGLGRARAVRRGVGRRSRDRAGGDRRVPGVALTRPVSRPSRSTSRKRNASGPSPTMPTDAPSIRSPSVVAVHGTSPPDTRWARVVGVIPRRGT